jgi:acetyl/propionyl-CoA carboxylase alpha subunit
MFSKILIANRGEIAVRIIRSCRDLGIATVALYIHTDRDSLHVRLADQAVEIFGAGRYGDADEVLAIAQRLGCDAIHPGYGFLAEEASFVQRCVESGIAFIGPTAETLQLVKNKQEAMRRVEAAGFHIPEILPLPDGEDDETLLLNLAERIGFPLVVKSAFGGRGRGARVIMNARRLLETVRIARHEAELIYGRSRLYFERAIAPSHYIAVQILADHHGAIVHLGEREGSLLRHNQKLMEESPAPSLKSGQRAVIWQMAVQIARLLNFQGVGTVEFLVDGDGKIYFTEMKGRIQIEHPVSEMVSDVDIVREQVRIAAGEHLSVEQSEVRLQGWSMQARINAEDPWNDFMPSPGAIQRFRLPQGMGVRVETYAYVGCTIPERFDSLLAKVVVWAPTREECLQRMQRALREFRILGVETNLPFQLDMVRDPRFVAGRYDTGFMQSFKVTSDVTPETLRDLAAIAAVAYTVRSERVNPVPAAHVERGWHRQARKLPQ